MTHTGVWQDSYRCVTWLIQAHDVCTHGPCSNPTAFYSVTWRTPMSHTIHSQPTRICKRPAPFEIYHCVTEWQPCIRCHKLHVSFRKTTLLIGLICGKWPRRQDVVCMLATLCNAHAMWYTHIDCYSCGMWYIWYHVWHMMHTYWFLFLWNTMEYYGHTSIAIPVACDTCNVMCDMWCTRIKSYFCGILCYMKPTYRLLFLCIWYSLHMIKASALAVSQYDDGVRKWNVLQCAVVCCSVLQCVCCSVLQWIAVRMSTYSCGIWYSLLHLQCHFSVPNPYRWSRSQGLFDHVSL